MKKLITLLCTIITVFTTRAQDITGQWNGVLKVQAVQLRIVFHITKMDSAYSATMDSPDQGAKGIPVTTTSFENPKLKLEVKNAGITYEGELKDNIIEGSFKQGTLSTQLNLTRDTAFQTALKRPQEPAPPYPYYTEEVSFINTKANITLAGTLSLPKKEGVYPAVILISGSGPQNRDEEVFGHKPFLVIADYLTRNGIAVLRYDDRGVAKSTGSFQTATSADFADDVESAIAYLKGRKEIDKLKIGLIGHSEGGMIAPMVAARSKDVHFIILMAGTGLRGDQVLLLQQELIAKASGVPAAAIEKGKVTNGKAFQMIVHATDNEQLKTDLTNYLTQIINDSTSGITVPNGMSREQFISLQVNQTMSPWMQYFIKYNPATALEKVKCPVLAVNGANDLQVAPNENLDAIKAALAKGGNKNVTIKVYPNLNHLFQESATGLPAEYGTIEQTFSPTVLEDMSKWILLQVK